MNAENTEPGADHPVRERHQALTIALHWLTALLVVTQFTLAILHEELGDPEIRRVVLTGHRSLGAVIWLLVLGRLAWRLVGMRLPPFPASMSRAHQWGARLSEWALYALLLVQPLTGMAATVLRGRSFDLFGIQALPLMPPHKAWGMIQVLHNLGGYALASLVLVHASAAILHRIVANDGVLDSMLYPVSGRRDIR